MEVRKAWLLALTLLTGAAGCITQTRGTAVTESNKPVDLASLPAGDRKSSAHCYVAYAQMQETNAQQPNVPEQTQQIFRENARQSYQKALEAEPNNAEALLGLARLAAGNRDEEKAKKYLSKVTQAYPNSATVWYEVGMLHCNHKNWQPALECLSRAYQLEPQNREIATKYGLTLARAGKVDQSIACLTPVMGKAQAHYTAARMLAHLNQKEQSKQQLQIALQFQADLQPARDMLAQLEGGPAPSRAGVVNIRFDQPAD